jgi:glycosyltransferase involved in cell wall biosynthesis
VSRASGGPRSVLLVTQYAPPSTLVAARRAAALVKYLGRAGHSVTVLTSAASGEGPIEGAEAVVRTKDALTSRLNWRRRHFAALAGGSGESYQPPSRLASVVVPDLSLLTWLPFALPAALRLAGTERLDCIMTTSPPPSVHLIGRALQRRGVPWIAELRDGWTFEPPHAPWPLAVQERIDQGLERRLLAYANAVIGVTEPIVEDLRRRYMIDAELITNGYDPDDDPPEPTGPDPLLNASRFSVVHTGRLALSGVSLQRVLDGVRAARDGDATLATGFEIVFAGSVSAEEQRLLAAPDLAELVHFVGWLERPRVLALQRAADALLVVTEGAGRRSVATGKLFEYFAAGRPILVLGDETEAAKLVTAAGAGFGAPVSDPRSIAAALQRLLGDPPGPAPAEAIRKYSYPALVARVAAVIARVTGG